MWWSKTARKEHLVIDLKNAGNLLVNETTGEPTKYQADLVEAFDYNVLEQCVSIARAKERIVDRRESVRRV